MSDSPDIHSVQEPIEQASPEVRAIVEQVLQLEKEKLYQRHSRHINDDILTIIKNVVQ